jgi:hypothetical protein
MNSSTRMKPLPLVTADDTFVVCIDAVVTDMWPIILRPGDIGGCRASSSDCFPTALPRDTRNRAALGGNLPTARAMLHSTSGSRAALDHQIISPLGGIRRDGAACCRGHAKATTPSEVHLIEIDKHIAGRNDKRRGWLLKEILALS